MPDNPVHQNPTWAWEDLSDYLVCACTRPDPWACSRNRKKRGEVDRGEVACYCICHEYAETPREIESTFPSPPTTVTVLKDQEEGQG